VAINPDLFGWDDVVYGSSVFQPLRFPGQYWDEETIAYAGSSPVRPGLHYNWNRYYDPYTGTYLQVDPKVEGTWEAYNYVEQNPVMRIDPSGQWGWVVVAIVAAAAYVATVEIVQSLYECTAKCARIKLGGIKNARILQQCRDRACATITNYRIRSPVHRARGVARTGVACAEPRKAAPLLEAFGVVVHNHQLMRRLLVRDTSKDERK